MGKVNRLFLINKYMKKDIKKEYRYDTLIFTLLFNHYYLDTNRRDMKKFTDSSKDEIRDNSLLIVPSPQLLK